jgi:hypothetical protein
MAAVNPQVFDSSGLKDIASAMPDVVGSTANAYKLKDMVDTSQMNTLKLAEAKKEITTREQTNEALRNLPLNATQEQRMQALEKIRQGPGGYAAAMDVMRNFGAVDKEAADRANVEAQTKKHLAEASAKTFEAYQDKVAAFDGNFLPVWQKFNDLVGKGMPVAQASAAVQPDYQRAYVGAISATDAAGNLIYNDPGSKQKFQQLGPTFDPDKLGPEIMQSEKVRKQLEEAQKARDESQFKGAETKLAEARARTIATTGEAGGGLDPSTIKNMAERVVIGGEKLSDVAGRLGSGTQGRRDLRDLQNEIARMTAERGIGPGGIVAQRQETAAQGRASQVAGAQAGKVAVGLAEVRQFGPLAIQASDAVPRGDFTPLSKLKQLGESKISDVNQKVFLVRHQAFLNAYNLVASRAGISASDRDHNRSLLEMADSPEAYRAGAQAIMFEAEQAEQAAQSAMKVPRAGAAAPAAAVSGGPNPVDKAGYDALPKGARYTMPGDPTVRVKQ